MRMDVDAFAEIEVLLWLSQRRCRRPRRLWVHEINGERPGFGSFGHLFPDFINNSDKFYDILG